MDKTFTEADARFELLLINSTSLELEKVDVITRLTNEGISQEVITRLEELWDKTRVVAGQLVHIGRIIIAQMIEFARENPNLALGVALGAALGALTSMIPIIGPLLAPLSGAIGVMLGIAAGSRADRGQDASDGVIRVAQEVIAVAMKFFELLANIFNALRAELK